MHLHPEMTKLNQAAVKVVFLLAKCIRATGLVPSAVLKLPNFLSSQIQAA